MGTIGCLIWRTCMVLVTVTIAAATEFNCSTSRFSFFPSNTINIPGGWNRANQTKAGNECDGYLLPIAIQGIPKPLLHFVPKHSLLALGGDVPTEYAPTAEQLQVLQNETAAAVQLASSQSMLLDQVLSEIDSSGEQQQVVQQQQDHAVQETMESGVQKRLQEVEKQDVSVKSSVPQQQQQQTGDQHVTLESGALHQQQQLLVLESESGLENSSMQQEKQQLQQESNARERQDTIEMTQPHNIIKGIANQLQLLQHQRQRQEYEKQLQAMEEFMQRRLLEVTSLQTSNSITDLLPTPAISAAAVPRHSQLAAAASLQLPADLLPTAAVGVAAGSSRRSAPKAAPGSSPRSAPKAVPGNHLLKDLLPSAGVTAAAAAAGSHAASSRSKAVPSAAGCRSGSAVQTAAGSLLPADLLPSAAVTAAAAAAGSKRIAMLNTAGTARLHQPDLLPTPGVGANSPSSAVSYNGSILEHGITSRLRMAAATKAAGKLVVDEAADTWTVAVPAQYNFSVTVNGQLWFRSQTLKGYSSIPVVNFNANVTEGRRDVFDPEIFSEGINTVVITVTILKGSAVITNGYNASIAPSQDETFSSPPIDFYFFMTSNATHDSRPSADFKVNSCKPEVSVQLTNTSPPPVLLDGYRLTYTPSSTTQAFFLPVYYAYGTFVEGLDGTTDLQSDGTDGNVKNFGVYVTRLPGSPDNFNITVPNLSLLKEGWYDLTVEGAVWSPNSQYDNLMSVAGIDKFGNKIADYLSVTAGGNLTDSISLYGGFKGAGWVLPKYNRTMVGFQRRPTWLNYFHGPETAITLGQRATFSWEFSGLGNASCKINGVDPGICTSPMAYPILTTLNQTLEVAYRDVCDKTHTVAMTFGTFGWEWNGSTVASELGGNDLLELADSIDLSAKRTVNGAARKSSNSAVGLVGQASLPQLLLTALATVVAMLMS